jgi:hypothetical protein
MTTIKKHEERIIDRVNYLQTKTKGKGIEAIIKDNICVDAYWYWMFFSIKIGDKCREKEEQRNAAKTKVITIKNDDDLSEGKENTNDEAIDSEADEI